MTGKCIYCGQQIIVDSGKTEEERDKLATKQCTCADAKAAAQNEATTLNAEENIKQLYKQDHPEVEELLIAALPLLADDKIAGITIDTGKRVKAKMTKSSKGNIKVERISTSKAVLES